MKTLSETEIKKRKSELKEQYLQIAGLDRIDKIERAILLSIRRRYEEQINEIFDSVLSRKLDCINFLLEH